MKFIKLTNFNLDNFKSILLNVNDITFVKDVGNCRHVHATVKGNQEVYWVKDEIDTIYAAIESSIDGELLNKDTRKSLNS